MAQEQDRNRGKDDGKGREWGVKGRKSKEREKKKAAPGCAGISLAFSVQSNRELRIEKTNKGVARDDWI